MACPILPFGGIYVITHVASGKVYVGSAVHVPKRWRTHKHDLNKRDHHSRMLQRAWKKYGSEAFRWEVVEPVFIKSELTAREQFWMDSLFACDPDKGYNTFPFARSPLGRKMSPETIENMRRIRLGVKLGPPTIEHRQNLSKARMGIGKGIPLSPEHAAKSAAHLRSPAVLEKLAAAMVAKRGQPLNAAHAAKVRAAVVARNVATKGIPMSAERRRQWKLACELLVARKSSEAGQMTLF